MKIQSTRKYNYQHNLSCKLKDRMINGQGLGDVSKLKYGLCSMSFNGCEVISVYNALRYAGKPQPLQEVAYFLEKYRMLMGVFGCNMFRLGKALEKYGVKYRKISSIGDTPAFIISFWTGRPFLSPAHTVFCVQEKGRICVYNRYNNCGTVRYGKVEKGLFGKYKPLVIYAVEK